MITAHWLIQLLIAGSQTINLSDEWYVDATLPNDGVGVNLINLSSYRNRLGYSYVLDNRFDEDRLRSECFNLADLANGILHDDEVLQAAGFRHDDHQMHLVGSDGNGRPTTGLRLDTNDGYLVYFMLKLSKWAVTECNICYYRDDILVDGWRYHSGVIPALRRMMNGDVGDDYWTQHDAVIHRHSRERLMYAVEQIPCAVIDAVIKEAE